MCREEKEKRWGRDMNVTWFRSRKETVYIMRGENRAGSRVWKSAGICNTVKNLFASKSNRNHRGCLC